MKTLVTGGAGFIGSHLVDELLKRGDEVIVIDNLDSGKFRNLQTHSNLRFYHEDICSSEIERLFRGVDVVFHLAAIPRVQFSIKYPKTTNRANVYGTLNILEACRKNCVKRFVYSASSSAYGDQDRLPLVETMNPNPMSPYALQKLVGEYYCKLYNLMHGMETFSLRYFNVFGPRQDPSGGYACLIPRSIQLVLNGKSPQINGDGSQTRDFTYVKDVVNANIVASKCSNPRAFGSVFNIGAGKNRSVNEVVSVIIGDSGIKSVYNPPVIEPKDTLADVSMAQEVLGWSPKWEFERALEETKEWFKENGKVG